MNSPAFQRVRPDSGNASLVNTLRVLIALSLLFISLFIMNHMLLMTLSDEESSSKVFVFNSLVKFEKDMFGLNQRKPEIATDPAKVYEPRTLQPVIDEPKAKPVPPVVTAPEPTKPKPKPKPKAKLAPQDNSPVSLIPPEPALRVDGTKVVRSMSDFKPHHLTCPSGELLEFWQPLTQKDLSYRTPYANKGPGTKYVIFEPDEGGWNNIRMQMEMVLVFALATGRTLVLPPDQPMYLLNQGSGHQKEHSFADFYPIEHIRQRLPVISMEEFMATEGVTGQMVNLQTGRVMYPHQNKTTYDTSGKRVRLLMWHFIRNVSYCPKYEGAKEFVVIPPAPGVNTSLLPPNKAQYYQTRLDVFSAKRRANYYDQKMHDFKAVHFISDSENGYRMLEHFYSFIHFQDRDMEMFYKRFVRDFVHYTDLIFCKAALIIKAILDEGGGAYSSFHIRRGDFQFKVVKIPAQDMLHNVAEFIPKGELVYIASDEKNASYFDPFLKRFEKVRFLKDYFDLAGLKDINPNYLGMIDQVICTRGTVFVGTWFSTFTGYITRMRGYLGYSDQSVYFGDMAHRDRYHKHELPMFPFYMREWNVSWDHID